MEYRQRTGPMGIFGPGDDGRLRRAEWDGSSPTGRGTQHRLQFIRDAGGSIVLHDTSNRNETYLQYVEELEEADMGNDISALLKAFLAAQAQVRGAKKDAQNPHFKSDYATLESVITAIKDPLNSNGLAFIQMPATCQNGGLRLVTRIYHMGGQFIESDFEVPLPKADPQGVGSALTYARRYALMAMMGIAPEDDDGNSATPKKRSAKKAPTKSKPKPDETTLPDPLSDDEIRAEIGELILAYTGGDKEAAGDELERLTSFPGKEGEVVGGVRSIRAMEDWSRKRLEVNYGKARRLVQNM
jgi:hypothetical protein